VSDARWRGGPSPAADREERPEPGRLTRETHAFSPRRADFDQETAGPWIALRYRVRPESRAEFAGDRLRLRESTVDYAQPWHQEVRRSHDGRA
jgi:hypothetical protein